MAPLLSVMNQDLPSFNQSTRDSSSQLETVSPRELEPLGISRELQSEGMHITWENLWVTVSNGRKGSKPILQGLTGYARPGEVLAIMGPSGCGKSTLLDALAGKQIISTCTCSKQIYTFLMHQQMT